MVCGAERDVLSFEVDATAPGHPLPNTSKMLALWDFDKDTFRDVARYKEHDVLEFAEYVQIFDATGGNNVRDSLPAPRRHATEQCWMTMTFPVSWRNAGTFCVSASRAATPRGPTIWNQEPPLLTAASFERPVLHLAEFVHAPERLLRVCA
jgi:hypothetical protein